MELTVTASELRSFCQRLLAAAGVPAEDAALTADALVAADLQGIDTHGVSRLPVYLRCLLRGRIRPRPRMRLERRAPALAVLDADHGLGQVAGVRAMEAALSLAREAGAGFVFVRHSNHFGAAGYYCELAARRGMAGLACTNTPPAIPPWGGRRPVLGTNPLAFAFPAPEGPVVVDLSCSVVARGHIIAAAREGRPIPPGWAVDAAGRPTTDPREALAGAVLPMGGPKGYALALAVEVLAGVLSGAAFAGGVGWMYDDRPEPVDMGHCLAALDIARLLPAKEYHERMARLVAEVRAVPPAEGQERVLVPGERRRLTAARRAAAGIPLPAAVARELAEAAARLGVAPPPALAAAAGAP